MKTLLLSLWLANGAIVTEPITEADCSLMLGAVAEVEAMQGWLTRELDGEEYIVARLACGDADVVLALPAGTGDCEVGS